MNADSQHVKHLFESKKRLIDVLPSEFSWSYQDTKAWKHKDVEVIEEIDTRRQRWPGPQKNVFTWWKLANGYAVAWNEDLSRGWSFPVINLAKLK